MRIVLAPQFISMKSLLSICLVAGSAWIASSSLTHSADKANPKGTNFFSCNFNGKAFSASVDDSSLAATFTYSDNKHLSPAALFINAEEKDGNGKSSLYI